MRKDVISPVSIDLGANNTGVYFAHYMSGSSLDEIDKEGRVYHLERDSYTLLMAKRTASRHQRRGYDRRRMAKRLFRLIWEKHFNLPWSKEVQQTVSFLLNRRGFSFLTEEYDADVLSSFPKEAYKELPEELRKDVEANGEVYDFSSAIDEWIQDQGVLEKKYRAITEPSRIKRNLLVINRSKTLKEYCGKRSTGKTIEEKRKRPILGRLSRRILEEWKSAGVKGLETVDVERNNVDMVAFLNKQTPERAQTILSSIKDRSEEEKELKSSVWRFDVENFDPEKAEFGQDEPNVKTHLNHLAFAIHKTRSELQSGGRHRSKYFQEIRNVFKEIEEVLKTGNKSKTGKLHGYLRHFYEELASGGYKGLDVKTFANLIGNISNLELKPLRKYFNDKKHRRGDYWDEKRLSEKFENWILREWRVNPQKDKLKAPGEYYDYKELRNSWKNWSGTVVDFWLDIDPNRTIPPYQDNNNRRPPRCQSLIISPAFLDENYKEWENWLRILKNLKTTQDYLEDYEGQFGNLRSGKGRPYFGQPGKGELKKDSGKRGRKHLNARVFQFILDRVKAQDPLKLNEIYSHAKKYRQNQSTAEEKKKARKQLEETIKKSSLPPELVTRISNKSDALFASGTFLHLVCRYYKVRQKARDGRIFIHPEYRYVKGRGYENTGRFNEKGHLLAYCNHKPRQKRYQVLGDLAALLQVSPQDLEQPCIVRQQKGDTINEKLLNWFESFGTLRTNCATAAKEQKDRRGRLKLDVQRVFGLVYHRTRSESPSSSEIRKILKDSTVKEALKLHNFCKRAESLCLSITQNFYTKEKQIQWQKELDRNPAAAVYLLAQINNVVFKERGGNSNTCSVCTMDNAQRMQTVKSGFTAKAQRLPAISTRLIDGAVKRMARIVGGAIADDKWGKIKDELKEGNKVCVPIIIESNRFEFEPSLKTLKNKPLDDKDRDYRKSDPLADKDERIKQDSNGICPYTGELLSGGDKDHIIPRSSPRYGTLNDEANLIWASERGNRNIKKGQDNFSLKQLNSEYKKKQFGFLKDEEIIKWIEDQIGDGRTDEFKFGKYRSFINLSPDERKAFRHALFLVDHPLRAKVIAAIDNRLRALVNGTQRHFAQNLADSLYRKAKALDRENLLSFDYFGIEAWDTTRGNGIRDLRKELVENYRRDLERFNKPEDSYQEAYSHLLDAQIAFCMALQEHQKEGSLRLNLQENGLGLWSRVMVNPKTGEVKTYDSSLFDRIQMSEENVEKKKLQHRKAYTIETHHRQLIGKKQKTNITIGYQIHRDGIIAERFFPLLKSPDGVIRKGFTLNNSTEFKGNLKDLQQFVEKLDKNDYDVWVVNKRRAQQFLMDVGYRGAGEDESNIAGMLDELSYQTIKKEISVVLTAGPGEKKPETVEEALERWNNHISKEQLGKNDVEKRWVWNQDSNEHISKEKFVKDGVVLPSYDEWRKLKEELGKANMEQELQEFLSNSNMFRNKHDKKSHNKTRKVFSLPVITGIGNIRIKRKSWNGKDIIQTVAEESFVKYGYEGKQRPHTILSKNSIPKKHYSGMPKDWDPQPLKWVDVPQEDIDDEDILHAQVIYKDAGRCDVKIKVRSVSNLSLPDNVEDWRGKVLVYKNDEEKRKGEDKDKNQRNHHCLDSKFRWLSIPFKLPKDRRDVRIKKSRDGILLEFTIGKTKKVEEWLLRDD